MGPLSSSVFLFQLPPLSLCLSHLVHLPPFVTVSMCCRPVDVCVTPYGFSVLLFDLLSPRRSTPFLTAPSLPAPSLPSDL